MKKKLMILGASILQLPAIRQAKRMGLDVIAVDMDANAIGFQEAGICTEIISTTDIPGVVSAAKRHKIDGIMTLASDMPMQTVAAVAEELHLAGIDRETAFCATNKHAMRERLRARGIPVPAFYYADSIATYREALAHFSKRCIVKPEDSSGSRGIFLLENVEDAALAEQAYIYSSSHSKSGGVLVEDYMCGPEVSVESLSVGGVCHVIQITDKQTTGAPYFVEVGHNQPSMLAEDIQDQIRKLAIAAVNAIGIRNSPAHTEIIITQSGPKIVELGARLGGDCITTHLVPISTGINMVEASIRLALGEEIEIPKTKNCGAAIRYFPQRKGVLQAIHGVDQAKQIAGIRQISIVKKAGSLVNTIHNSGDRIGFVIAEGTNVQQAVAVCEQAINHIEIQIIKPKLLLLQSYFRPERIASTHLFDDLFSAFLQSGYRLEIYAPYPTRGISKAERKNCIANQRHERLCNGDLEIHRFALFGEKKNSLQRAFRYLLCIIMQTVCGLRAKDCDALFISSTPPINGLMMAVLKRFKKYKIVYNLQDIFPDSLVHTGMTHEGSLLWKIGRWVENVTYRAADEIIVISEDFKKNIMAKGVPEEKIKVVYNWVDENTVVPVPRTENTLFEKFNLDPSKFYITYCGNIGYTQNMEMLVQVAKSLQAHTNIHFVLVGDGAFAPKLRELLETEQLQNVTMLPFQDYADISKVFSLGDAGLIISKKGVGSNSVPSKTWSIMSAERPVLASFDKGTELDHIITDNNCGICVDADDAETLKQAILYMAKSPDDLAKMGANGRAFILKNCTKEIGTKKIIQILRQVMQSEPSNKIENKQTEQLQR